MAGFKPGDMILISNPYAYVLNNKVRGIRCDCCFKKNPSLKRCGQCYLVHYCTKSCQVKAWKDHKTECKFLKKCKSIPIPEVRLISLIIFKLKKYGQNEPMEEVYGRKVTFGTLMSHAKEIKNSSEVFQEANRLMDEVQDFIGPENMPSSEEFIEIYGKVIINQFDIEEAIQTIGAGLYLGASVINHSCHPNAEPVFCGVEMWVRAKKHIPDKDISQVRITYIDELELPNERREDLMSRYFFECQCYRCTDDYLANEMTKLFVAKKDAVPYLIRINSDLLFLKRLKDLPGHTDLLREKCLEELEDLLEMNVLGDTHISKIKALHELYDACMKSGEHEKALEYGLQLIKPYKLFLGPYHSTLGYLLYELSSLLFEQGEIIQFLGPREEAKEILMVTMGEEHPMYKVFFGGPSFSESSFKNIDFPCGREMFKKQ